MAKPIRHHVITWAFRLTALAVLVWLTYDTLNHRVDWLLLTACICFYILGGLTHVG